MVGLIVGQRPEDYINILTIEKALLLALNLLNDSKSFISIDQDNKLTQAEIEDAHTWVSDMAYVLRNYPDAESQEITETV